MGEGYLVLGSYRMSHNYFVYIVELVPVLVKVTQIAVQRLEFRATGDSDVESFSSK